MAVHKSTQLANLALSPPVFGDASEGGGRVRKKWFDFTVPAGNAAVNDTVELLRIPKGSRILGGKIATDGMSSGAGAASIQLGDGTTATKYLGTTSVDTAGTSEFANTLALNFGEKLASELLLTATVITEAWAAGKLLKGYVEYAQD